MASVNIFVHDLGSREIRVRFDAPVEDADVATAYALTSSTGHIPAIAGVVYYDADKTSVKIILSSALTLGSTYSCQVSGLFSSDGIPVSSTPFSFSASDSEDYPKVLGAFLSKRGHIDILFDRPVATYSTAATASLRTFGSVAMTLVPWSAGQSENAVRFSFSSAPVGSSYWISFSNVRDVSGNTFPDRTSLFLPYTPSGYASLVNARVIEAHVVDVSNASGFATAVLRVFFNCPMLASDVLNQSHWGLSQGGSHVAADTGNLITALDAMNTLTFIALANDAKSMINSHLLSHAHRVRDFASQIVTDDAIDYASAWNLTEELCGVYSSHLGREDMHLYADRIHSLDSSIEDQLLRLNFLKGVFNEHLEESYVLAFSSAYDPIGPIVNFASSANAPVVSDQFTWFVDLHVATSAVQAPFVVSISGLHSEDSASSITGTTVIDPMISPVDPMSVVSSFRGASVRMSCGIGIQDVDAVFLKDLNENTPVKIAAVSATSSLPAILWAYNNLVTAYKLHIRNPSASPYLEAGHRVVDTTNVIVSSDYATTLSLSTLIAKANTFKSKISAHMTSEAYHYGKDAEVETPDATDASSLSSLVAGMQTYLSRHNSSGFSSVYRGDGMVAPAVPAYHEYPGSGIISASVYDTISVTVDGAIHGHILALSAPVAKTWRDNYPDISDRMIPGLVEGMLVAVDSLPVLASAVPRPGFMAANPSRLLSDVVELYLSKPMRNQALLVNTNVVIFGDAISMIDAEWVTDRVAYVHVTNMSSASYLVDAFGIRDVAGNLVYAAPAM